MCTFDWFPIVNEILRRHYTDCLNDFVTRKSLSNAGNPFQTRTAFLHHQILIEMIHKWKGRI